MQRTGTFERTLDVKVISVTNVQASPFKVSDIGKTITRVATRNKNGPRIYPRVRIRLPNGAVAKTKWVEACDGAAEYGDTLIVSLDGIDIETEPLRVELVNAVGFERAASGSPVIGTANTPIIEGETEVSVTRDEMEKGSIRIQMTLSKRVKRDLTLAKTIIHNDVDMFDRESHSHWAIAACKYDMEDRVYEILAVGLKSPAPLAIIGPSGIIAHTVPPDDWENWKVLAFHGGDATVPGQQVSDEVIKELRPRKLDQFNSLIDDVGTTFRSEEEIAAWVKEWIGDHDHFISDSDSRTFVQEFFTYLTCGQTISQLHNMGAFLGTAGRTFAAVGKKIMSAAKDIGASIMNSKTPKSLQGPESIDDPLGGGRQRYTRQDMCNESAPVPPSDSETTTASNHPLVI